MVDVSSKEPTKRTATATGRIYIPQVAYELITERPADSARTRRDPSSSEPLPIINESAPALDALEQAKRKARAKGDVLAVAQLAAIMGCKRTADLIPLCHPLQLSHISVHLYPEQACGGHEEEQREFESDSDVNMHRRSTDASAAPSPSAFSVRCVASVTCEGKTGVEMEALTAVSVGLLTVWDMLKAVAGREMVMGEIAVVEKHGGKSGDFTRSEM